jgi:hypothetical protein
MPAGQEGRNAAAADTLCGCNAPGDLRTAVGKPPNDRVQWRKSRHSPASLEAIDGVFAAGKKIIIAASSSSGYAGLVGEVMHDGMPDGRRACEQVLPSLNACRQRADCVRRRTIGGDCRHVCRSACSAKPRRNDRRHLECRYEMPPVFVIATRPSANPDSMLRYQKALSVSDCAKGRGRKASVPRASEPLPELVPLEVFAYDWAALTDCHVGHPRDLAKTTLTE